MDDVIMTLTLQMPGADPFRHQFVMKPYDSILEAKQHFEAASGIEVARQTAIHNGKEVEDNRSLLHYGFTTFGDLDISVAPDPNFPVNVKYLDQQVPIIVTASTAVATLRSKVASRFFFFTNSIILVHNGQMMLDHHPLSYYNIEVDSLVEVAVQEKDEEHLQLIFS